MKTLKVMLHAHSFLLIRLFTYSLTNFVDIHVRRHAHKGQANGIMAS
jgi:hypothetical protein